MSQVFIVTETHEDVTTIDSVWTTEQKANIKKAKLEQEKTEYEGNYEYEVEEKKVLQ